MVANLRQNNTAYRQGVVLGLTMAEIMLLLVFILLLVTAVMIKQERDRNKLFTDVRDKWASTKYSDDDLKMSLDAILKMAQARQAKKPGSTQSVVLAEVIKANEALISDPRMSEVSENWDKLKLADEILSNFREAENPVDTALKAIEQSRETKQLLQEAGLNSENPELTGRLIREFVADRQAEGKYNLIPSIILNDAEGNTFEIGKAELKPDFERKIINDVIPQLLEKVAKYDLDVIEVIGHTDDLPIRELKSNLDETLKRALKGEVPIGELIASDNAGLGLSRAVAVARLLMNEKKMAPLRILPLSAAQLTSLDEALTGQDSTTPDSKRRRIEIRLRPSRTTQAPQ